MEIVGYSVSWGGGSWFFGWLTVVDAVDAPGGFARHVGEAILGLAVDANVACVILMLGIGDSYGYH